MEAFWNEISNLAKAIKGDNKTVSRIVCSIVATMSDQSTTNPVFNRQLLELKQTLLPDVVENWDELSDVKKMEIGKISSFFCKMHIFVNMASEVDKCLAAFETNV